MASHFRHQRRCLPSRLASVLPDTMPLVVPLTYLWIVAVEALQDWHVHAMW